MDGIKEIKMRWLKKGDRLPAGLAFEFDYSADVFHNPSPQVRVCLVPSGQKPMVVEMGRGLSIEFDHDKDFVDLKAEPHLVGDPTGGYQRMVYNYAGAGSALPVRAGLTVHETRGTWSSWPPHGFEQEALRSPGPVNFVEKFAYVTLPPGGWGVQVRVGKFPQTFVTNSDYGLSVDDIVLVKDRDIVRIPAGSHPTGAGPGVRLAYFWAYTSEFELPEKFGEGGWE